MEKNNFIWIFFIATFVVGTFLGIAYSNITMTGKAASQNQNVILPVSCNDSDGGWNLGLKGTCTDGNETNYTDSCYTQNINGSNRTFLKEYFCMSGRCSSSPYSCEALGKKCVNGACLGNATNYSASVTGAGGAGGTCSGVTTIQTAETVDISQVPPGEKIYTKGELTESFYGTLQDDSQMNKKMLPTDEPSITLGMLCEDLVVKAVKQSARYTASSGKACWPMCFGDNGEVLCNEQCNPTSITVIKKLPCVWSRIDDHEPHCVPWSGWACQGSCSGYEYQS